MASKHYLLKIFVLAALTFTLLTPHHIHALETIQITPISTDVSTPFATFQSHNQKVVSNQYGIFVSYLAGQNEDYTKNYWKLIRSTDGGVSFSTLYEKSNLGTSAPVIETDMSGRIYLAHPDWSNAANPTTFYRFSPNTGFTQPDYVVTVPDSGGGKYAMVIDESRGQLYFIAHHGTLVTLTLNGQIVSTTPLLAAGPNAYPMYPNLYLDSTNTLYLAWTTQKRTHYLYHDIHFMRSPNGGVTWQKSDGTSLSTPVVVDDTGPTERITLDDEFDYHTFLSSFLVKGDKAHFFYLSQSTPSRQHYVRYNLTTHRIDKNIYPTWQGQTISIRSLDGFCATNPKDQSSPIYCTANTPSGTISTLVSYDHGDSWQDYATSELTSTSGYSIGGARYITSDGYIIGTYTVQDNSGANSHDVHFLKIKTSKPASPSPSPAPKPGDLNGDGSVNIADFNLLITNFGSPYTILHFNQIVSNYGK